MTGLSILIPLYNYDATVLVAELRAQTRDWPGPVEICLLDDGSRAEFRRRHQPLGALPGVRYAELPANVGRAAVRNALVARAQHEWLLLLDNDSRLPDGQFLARYAAAATQPHPVVIGGTTYAATPPTSPALQLRWRYGRAREMRPAAARQRDPGGQFNVNNALIHRDIMNYFSFDETLSGYGHEDTRLGLELAQAGVQPRHLDNPVLHAGLEPAAVFLDKSRQAVRNLAQVLRTAGLGADTRLVRAATRLRRLGLAAPARAALAALGPLLRRNLLSARPRLPALDLLKLSWLLQEQW